MKFWAWFDVGKALHWLCALDGEGETVFGLDMAGEPATLLVSILLERGERVLSVPGMAVTRSREAYS